MDDGVYRTDRIDVDGAEHGRIEGRQLGNAMLVVDHELDPRLVLLVVRPVVAHPR